MVAGVLVLGACNDGGGAKAVPGEFQAKGEKLLSVDGKYAVTSDMMEAVTRNMPAPILEARKESGEYAKMVEQVGLGEMLYRQAIEAKLHEDPDVQKAIAMKMREALAQELLASRVEERVNDAAIQALYDERAVRFKKPQARARHILVTEEALANEIMEKLGKGEDFATLAKEFTIDARTRGDGGDLGWFEREGKLEEVAAVAFDAELNKPQGPIQSRFGFHIIEPLERRDAIPLEEVRDELEGELRQKEYAKVIEEVKASLDYEYFGEVKEMHEKVDAWGVGTPGAPGAMPGGMPPHPPGGK
jgi:hypothetical protein